MNFATIAWDIDATGDAPFHRASKNSVSEGVINRQALAASLIESERRFFEARANQWLKETAFDSSLSRITRHPKFFEIARMGNAAIELVLERMVAGDIQLHWFPLLKRISQADPVPPEDRGFVEKMASHWIEWGRASGKC